MAKIAPSSQFVARTITPDEFNLAASLIYQAYHDDPLFMALFKAQSAQDTDYEKRLRTLIREELRCFWEQQQLLVGLYVDGDMKAIACVMEQGSELEAKRYWHWRLKLMMSAGFLTTQQLIDKETRIQGELSQFGHYFFLAFIAVDPHYQGQHLGSALLHALCEHVDEDESASGLGVFVTETNHRAFFAESGFDTVSELAFNRVSGALMFRKRREEV